MARVDYGAATHDYPGTPEFVHFAWGRHTAVRLTPLYEREKKKLNV
jgi:hypothetical protein